MAFDREALCAQLMRFARGPAISQAAYNFPRALDRSTCIGGLCVRIKWMRLLVIFIAVPLLSVTTRAGAPTAGITVNLSRDMVRLGIATQNLPANDPSFDARPIFEAAVQYVGTHHVERLTVDRGAYYFLTPQDAQTYLRFRSLSDLTIDLAGSRISFAGAFLQGFALVDCDHVTLTNFDIDFLEPPYTQVELLSVDPSARTIAYRTLPQWRDPARFDSPSAPGEAAASLVFWAVAFRGGEVVPGTSRMQVAQPIAAGLLRLVQDNTPWTQSSTLDRKSTRLNSSHYSRSRMPSSA